MTFKSKWRRYHSAGSTWFFRPVKSCGIGIIYNESSTFIFFWTRTQMKLNWLKLVLMLDLFNVLKLDVQFTFYINLTLIAWKKKFTIPRRSNYRAFPLNFSLRMWRKYFHANTIHEHNSWEADIMSSYMKKLSFMTFYKNLV